MNSSGSRPTIAGRIGSKHIRAASGAGAIRHLLRPRSYQFEDTHASYRIHRRERNRVLRRTRA